MTCLRSIPCLSLLVLALACGESPSDDGVGSSSEAGSTSSPTTTSPTSESSAPTTTADSGSEEASSTQDGESSSGEASSGSESDASSSGGPTNDCTDQAEPCVLELDTPVGGAGGVDQFFVYTVADGAEHVRLEAVAFDYVNWDVTPGTFLCNPDGPCCLSDGAVCDKPLVRQGLALAPGDTAYVYVYATAPYELAITSG